MNLNFTDRVSKNQKKDMATIEEAEEKETIHTNNSQGKILPDKPKALKKPKKKKKEKLIEERPRTTKTMDIRSSLEDLKKKTESSNLIETRERERDSGWCSKKLIKKPDEVNLVNGTDFRIN